MSQAFQLPRAFQGFFFLAEFSEISLVTVNLVTLREMLIPLRKNLVKFEFQVQNKGLDPGACFVRLVGWRVVVANLAAGSGRSRVRVILPYFFYFFGIFSVQLHQNSKKYTQMGQQSL
jgi:hypothetical protein